MEGLGVSAVQAKGPAVTEGTSWAIGHLKEDGRDRGIVNKGGAR